MLMEWVSAPSMVGQLNARTATVWLAMKSAKAWPASWVSTSTSPEVPLKLEKIKGHW